MSLVSSGVYVAGVYLVYRCLSVLVGVYLRKRCTVLDELQNLGKPRKDGEKIRGTVVIAGGSLAGLWTSRVCAEHFERVLVIEPDLHIHTKVNVARHGSDIKYAGEDRMKTLTNPHVHVAQYNSLHRKLLKPAHMQNR